MMFFVLLTLLIVVLELLFDWRGTILPAIGLMLWMTIKGMHHDIQAWRARKASAGASTADK
jgi:hypothetical protein